MTVAVKRGYTNGAKTIEIIEGNIDLILYNDKATSFFYYRFKPQDVLGEPLGRTLNMYYREQVEPYIARYGKEYDGFINELLQFAIDNNIQERYDM